MPVVTKERSMDSAITAGCRVCGQKRSMVRRYGLRLCRQCFRDNARDLGFAKYS